MWNSQEPGRKKIETIETKSLQKGRLMGVAQRLQVFVSTAVPRVQHSL